MHSSPISYYSIATDAMGTDGNGIHTVVTPPIEVLMKHWVAAALTYVLMHNVVLHATEERL